MYSIVYKSHRDTTWINGLHGLLTKGLLESAVTNGQALGHPTCNTELASAQQT